jgi:hypothetical protein
MSPTRAFRSPSIALISAGTVTRHDRDDQIGRNNAKRHPASDCERRETETTVYTAAKDEARSCGNSEGGERLIPNVLANITMSWRAIA